MTDLTREQIERMMAMAQFAVKQKLDESQSTIEPSKMVALCQLALQAPQFQPDPPSDVMAEVTRHLHEALAEPRKDKRDREIYAALQALTRLGVKGE